MINIIYYTKRRKGLKIYYNFFRPNQYHSVITPADVANIDLNLEKLNSKVFLSRAWSIQ